jgi:hypothetical protein
MNARSYRVNLIVSPVDFPAINGMGESTINYHSEPKLINNNVVLSIAKKYILLDVFNNKQHEILETQSIYEIPVNEIKTRNDVYEFYNDATRSLNEAYQVALTELPTLHKIVFPNIPMENYKGEIDRVFNLLNSRS